MSPLGQVPNFDMELKKKIKKKSISSTFYQSSSSQHNQGWAEKLTSFSLQFQLHEEQL